MPNHCHNRVTFYSDDTTVITKLHNIFKIALDPNDERTVFGQFIPEPNWQEIPLTSETFKEYSWDQPRGEIGEKPILVTDDECSFRNGLRFKSTDRQDDRWYAWRNQNWGTKWDVAGNVDIEKEEWEDEIESFEANFETAWAPPEGVCMRLRQLFPDVHISWFYDEPGNECAGYL